MSSETKKVDPDSFQARDMNTEFAPRTHSFDGLGPDGDSLDITFERGRKWRPVPRTVGMKLAAIEGFEVKDQDGRPVVIKPGKATSAAVIHFAPDEVIARLDELTTSALAARVKATTKFDPPKDAKREDMIAVLLQNAGQTPADEADLQAPKAA